jgi:DNA-binding CsgD family transcriptional regulator/tetratricopeptide (TPR) repeat protein
LLDRLLEAVRGGESRVLVVRGEPGVGKSALLEYVAERSSGCRVARAAGVQSEMELAYAGLHQLCAPMLGCREHLPEPQRNALDTAFGLMKGTAPDRFLVSLAALGLASDAANERPLVCLVDDAQWLDRESLRALEFVARRLFAESVALVFGARSSADDQLLEPFQERVLPGLPELVLEGLGDEDARALLDSAIHERLDERVRDRIIAETRGNPLALLELPRGLSPANLAGGFAPPDARALSGKIEDSFRGRLGRLPAQTQRLLLLAAAEPIGDASLVWRAADSLGIDPAAADAAESDRLVEFGRRVTFRHALVRSATYTASSPQQRREVHGALAEATDRQLDPDRRAWHLAQATPGPDDEVASELERSASRAQARGGLSAAAAFLERSAALTPDPSMQALRRLQAAGACLAAGANERAQALLGESLPHLSDPAARAQASRMEGAIRFAGGRGGDTPALLFDAAMSLRDLDPLLARETLLESLEAAMWAGNLTSGTTMLNVAEAARTSPAPDNAENAASLLLTGYGLRFTVGYPAAIDWWRRAVDEHREENPPRLQWQGMLWNATGEMLDFDAHIATARERVRLAREHGALAELPVALSCLAWNELLGGRTEAGEALVAEAAEIAAATGAPSMPAAEGIGRLGFLSWRGNEEETRRQAESVTAGAVAGGQGLGVTLAQFFLMKLELGLGRYEEARICALNVFEEDSPYTGTMALGDAVEAMARAGDMNSARAALERLSERALASGASWGMGLLARSRALLAPDTAAEALFKEALAYLARSGVASELARAHLLYGEWLRRERRRRDAREQLRAAHEMFLTMGADGFGERTRRELLATGETARKRTAETRSELTAQETQVARLARDGLTNPEIGARLFISASTVQYHLRKVFMKLDINSRVQLGRVLPGDPATTSQG